MRSYVSSTLLLFGILLSCTRSPVSSTAVINLGNVNAQSLGNVRVLILNVSGPSMQRIIYQWSCPNEECTTSDIPTQIEIEVPAGSQRLFQVIVAGENSANNTVQFNYDDEQLDVSGSSMPLALTPTPLASGGSMFDFGGRYSVDGTNFHSGWIDMVYQPPGKPAMVIESHYMFAGWFRLFGVDGAGFSYVKRENGAAIFSNVSLSSLDTTVIPGKYARFEKPSYYYDGDENTVGVQCTPNPSSKEYSILGFFGPSSYTSSKSIQYSNTPSTYTFSTLWESSDCSTTPYEWNISGSSTESRPVDAFSSGSSTPCNGTEFTTCLLYEHKGIQNSNEYEFRIHGPFRAFQDGGNDVFVSVTAGDLDTEGDGTDLRFRYTLLPGVTSSIVSGVDYFVNRNTDESSIDSEDISCAALTSDGYVTLTDIFSSTSTPSSSGELFEVIYQEVPAAGAPGSFTLVVACPYVLSGSTKVYYDKASVSGYGIN